MDLAQLAVIVDVDVLPSLDAEAEKETRGIDLPAERATAMIGLAARLIESHLAAQDEDHE